MVSVVEKYMVFFLEFIDLGIFFLFLVLIIYRGLYFLFFFCYYVLYDGIVIGVLWWEIEILVCEDLLELFVLYEFFL